MSNRQKFRKPHQQSKTTKQGVRGTLLGQQGSSEAEQLRETVKQIGEGANQIVKEMQEVLDRSGKAKRAKGTGAKGKKRKAPRKQKRTSGINQRQPPPGQATRGTGGEDEFDRVVAMLESIRKTLENLVFVTSRAVPQELHPPIVQSWHRADEGFRSAMSTLQDLTQRVEQEPKLEAAGFTGEMLDMKETSLKYHMARVDKAILTYNNRDTMLDKFLRWIKPGFKVMNSVLGSLSSIPGVEVGKEFKEHLESAYEVVETGQVE